MRRGQMIASTSFMPQRIGPLAFALLAVACTRKDPGPAVQIAAGRMHVCARTASGSVLCWGSNRDGQLGTADARETGPVQVPFLRGVRDLAASGSTSCAVVEAGEVECWGMVWTKSFQERRQRIPGVHGALHIMMAGMRACALAADGAATCWGPGDEGRRAPGGWPPAADERFRGSLSGEGGNDVLCAKLGDRFRCSAERGDPLDFPGADASAVLDAARQICLLRSGAVGCRTVGPTGELAGAEEITQAGFSGLVSFDRFLCGPALGTVACFDSALPPRDRRVRALSGFGAATRLAAGSESLCGLTAKGEVFCTDRPDRPARLVLPAAHRAE